MFTLVVNVYVVLTRRLLNQFTDVSVSNLEKVVLALKIGIVLDGYDFDRAVIKLKERFDFF